jgi:ribosome biogenesis GTPase
LENRVGGLIIKGRIIKCIAGAFFVFCNDKIYECFARKKLKHNNARLYVGDFVDFNADDADIGIIERVYDRKNFFIRPYVSNIDQALIIIAPTPAPDLLLVDKMLVKCKIENVTAVILINKSDIDENEKFSKQILYDYENAAKIMIISAAKNDNIDGLLDILRDKLSCCVGQSAVGKTSILNALNTDRILKTDRLSRKIERGRHTTRHSEIYTLKNGGFIIDTPGFNLYHLDDVDFHSLAAHYNDFFDLSTHCKYKMCTHINEPDCAVKNAAANGELSKNRYDRYVRLFNELYKREKNKY